MGLRRQARLTLCRGGVVGPLTLGPERGAVDGVGPAWASGRTAAGNRIKALIADELSAALERLGAEEELLSIVSSWGDTLDEAEILELLRHYNATGRALRPLR
jgi:hypothetical protein